MDHDISIFDNSLGCFALIFTDEEHIEINPLLNRLYPRSYRVYLYVMIWGEREKPRSPNTLFEKVQTCPNGLALLGLRPRTSIVYKKRKLNKMKGINILIDWVILSYLFEKIFTYLTPTV